MHYTQEVAAIYKSSKNGVIVSKPLVKGDLSRREETLKLVIRQGTASSPYCLTLASNNTIIKNYSVDDLWQAESDFTKYWEQFHK